MNDFEWWINKHGSLYEAYASISPEYKAIITKKEYTMNNIDTVNKPWSDETLQAQFEVEGKGSKDLIKVVVQTEEETGPKDESLPM